MKVRLACIVEGHGEIQAAPILMRRLVTVINERELGVAHPIRVPRSKLLRPGVLEKAVQLAAAKVAPDGGLLILLDADDDCPVRLAPELRDRATKARCDIPISVVIANREFESWFVAAADSLRGHRGLSEALDTPADPEQIRGAKEWLKQRLERGNYSETVDQPALASIFDLIAARRAPSFDRLWREIDRPVRPLAPRCA